MPDASDSSQALFRNEYEQELAVWLRRRFAYLCTAFFVLGAIRLAVQGLALAGLLGTGAPAARLGAGAVLAIEAALSVAVVAAFFSQRGRHATREDMLRAVTWMILLLGALSLAGRFLVEWLGITFASGVIWSIFFWHFTACVFLPWTPRESLQPILPLLIVWAIGSLIDATAAPVDRLLQVMFSPGVLLPGLAIAGWRLQRHSRLFRQTMMGRHFRTMRQEFSRARRIHESLFPGEYDDGHVRVQYTYEPMRELGGDFLYVRSSPGGHVTVTVLDVTGHGLAAALTVNRISGELERIYGESPDAAPGQVLTLLNRYLCLTMVRHNIYATAIAMRIDPYVGEVCWASGGHPPALLRGANGVVRQLDSTAVVLGALDDEEFAVREQTYELAPGDVIVAYTDGVIEARNRGGSQFGVPRLRELLHRKPAPGNWPQFIAASVDRFMVGRAEDDILVTAVLFAGSRVPATATASGVLTEP